MISVSTGNLASGVIQEWLTIVHITVSHGSEYTVVRATQKVNGK